MGFSQLDPRNIDDFAREPEVAMDVQIGIDSSNDYVLVVAGRLTLVIDELLDHQMANYREFNLHDSLRIPEQQAEAMEGWTRTLPTIDNIRPAPLEDALAVIGFIHLGPHAPLPPAPPSPHYIYGHLPFHGICSGDEVFYRYESYPTSKRIDQKAGKIIMPGTFAAPTSELAFVPTGLAAVARYALQSLLPARWRYELRPAPRTHMKYGACVPQYGQSGGGVEVMFTNPFANVGPIANPIVLPIF